MSGSRSRGKGKVGERELAAELRRIGFTDARRGVQYRGGPDSPDVVGIPGLHVECKRAESFSIYTALAQAIEDAGALEIPVVAHRKNHKPWVLIVPLDFVVGFARAVHEALGYEVAYAKRDERVEPTPSEPPAV